MRQEAFSSVSVIYLFTYTDSMLIWNKCFSHIPSIKRLTDFQVKRLRAGFTFLEIYCFIHLYNSVTEGRESLIQKGAKTKTQIRILLPPLSHSVFPFLFCLIFRYCFPSPYSVRVHVPNFSIPLNLNPLVRQFVHLRNRRDPSLWLLFP